MNHNGDHFEMNWLLVHMTRSSRSSNATHPRHRRVLLYLVNTMTSWVSARPMTTSAQMHSNGDRECQLTLVSPSRRIITDEYPQPPGIPYKPDSQTGIVRLLPRTSHQPLNSHRILSLVNSPHVDFLLI